MKRKNMVSIAMAAVLFASALAGCGGKDQTAAPEGQSGADVSTEGNQAGASADQKEEIVMNLLAYKAGENTGAKLFLPQVERFNEKYKGTYRIEIEQIPQESYNDKIKQLAQQNMLPTLVDGGDKNWLQEYVYPNNLTYDLGPWLEEHPEVKNVLIDDSLEYATRDGKVVAMPLAISRPVGLFYNTSMYTPSKPIREMTFEEFSADLGGENKVALATGGPAFMTQLVFTAMIANEPGGEELLLQGFEEKIVDYNNEIFISASAKLQEFAMNNGADNCISAAGPDAMNYFLSKKASVIPNGPWFAAEFDPEKADKWSNGFNGEEINADIYPGNVVVCNLRDTTWWIPDSASDDQKEIALAFLEFLYSQEELETALLEEGGLAPNLTYSDAFAAKQSENKVYSQLDQAIDENTIYAIQVDQVMPSSLSSAEFGKIVIKLFDGTLTPEEFCQALTEKAQMSVQ